MHRSDDALVSAMLTLVRFLNDPRQDRRLMAEAGLDLDPAFLPLLVRLGMDGPAGVVELSGPLGRDHSTVSRQLARLEAAGLVARSASQADGRVRTAQVTPRGGDGGCWIMSSPTGARKHARPWAGCSPVSPTR